LPLSAENLVRPMVFPAMRCAFATDDRAFGRTLVLRRNMAGGERGAPYFEPGSM
jgi:hypothetical protein